MEAIILIITVLAYCFILKLIEYCLSKKTMHKEDTYGEYTMGTNKFNKISMINLTSHTLSNQLHPESRETIALIFTDKDSFHEEWEILEDSDLNKVDQHPDFNSKEIKH